MFTGLIEAVGTIDAIRPTSDGRRVRIATGGLSGPLAPGESVAVDGVCLTVVDPEDGAFTADVVPETLARTTLGRAASGRRVNLERALRLGDRLGGHWVQGHVDGCGRLRRVDRGPDGVRLAVELAPALRRYVAGKGSIALDGVSLTVAARGEDLFEVALIPETLERTTLGGREAGETLNIEVDLIARYLETLTGGTP